ncbi:hypothetical protein ACK8GG_11190 [Micromonosporaceae bacterium DT55]|uniref:hypothetical protein n=1 Tax=Melissospora conviva TaxID=3388432 RepID=UPI003C1DEFED
MTVELIAGRYRYRLVHRYRPEFGGGKEVVGEVASVADLERLLRRRSPITLADLHEVA